MFMKEESENTHIFIIAACYKSHQLCWTFSNLNKGYVSYLHLIIKGIVFPSSVVVHHAIWASA